MTAAAVKAAATRDAAAVAAAAGAVVAEAGIRSSISCSKGKKSEKVPESEYKCDRILLLL
jgi:hypothetical protein